MPDLFNITGRIQQIFKNYSLNIKRDKKGNITETLTVSNDDTKNISSLEELRSNLLSFYPDRKSSSGFDIIMSKQIKLEDVQRICQRMVRKKHKCMDIIKALDGFVPNPNPNS